MLFPNKFNRQQSNDSEAVASERPKQTQEQAYAQYDWMMAGCKGPNPGLPVQEEPLRDSESVGSEKPKRTREQAYAQYDWMMSGGKGPNPGLPVKDTPEK